MKRINKRVDYEGFHGREGDKVYLLGQDKDNKLIWLKSPSWDCGWYWGFGYVEIYTNNKHPHLAKSIQSHSHFEGLTGFNYQYDWEKKAYIRGEYIYHLNENPEMAATVLNNNESWELADLMKRFYTLSETARILTYGTGHLTSRTSHKTKNKTFLRWINEKELPAIFAAVIRLLEPESSAK